MSTLKLTTPNLVRPCASRSRVAVRAAHGDKIARRDLLLGSAGAAVGVAASLWVPASASAVSLQFSDIPVESLSAPQVRAQQEAYRVSCEKILRT